MEFSPMSELLTTSAPVLWVIIIGGILVWAIRSAKARRQNARCPVGSVEAVVVSKRTNVLHENPQNRNTLSSTTYYVAFQIEDGDWREFNVTSKEYSMLVEQARGQLTFQGNRYYGFEQYE